MHRVRIAVDDVIPTPQPLPTRPLSEVLGDAVCFGGEAWTPCIDHGPTRALLGAAHMAFADHRPLTLTPDAVWLTIAEGVAQHIRLNAETLRHRLVRHQGKRQLVVTHDGAMPRTTDEWRRAIGGWRDLIAKHVGEGRARLFECDFSTSTPVDRVASQIVLMDAYAPYFDFAWACICGIPEVRLWGTPDDWRSIRARLDVIEELDLKWWTRSLKPILDECVSAAEGRAERAFWKRMVKPEDAYGGDVITGWVARLYPYLKDDASTYTRRNPLLELPLGEPSGATVDGRAGVMGYQGPGIFTSDVPNVASSAPVEVHDLDGTVRHVTLEGGLMAVAQEPDRGLLPISAWALREGTTLAVDDVLARIEAEGETVPARGERRRTGGFGQPVLAAFFGRHHAATFGPEDRRWHVRPMRDHENITPKEAPLHVTVARVFDGPDGDYLGLVHGVWVRGRVSALGPATLRHEATPSFGSERQTSQTAQELRVVGRSALELMAHMLEGTPLPDLGPLSEDPTFIRWS